MDNPKYKITLKAIKDINGHKAGSIVIIINEIFNRNNGVAFFSIDKEFEIISQQLFTGLKDINGVDVFEKDAITTKYSNHQEVEFYVKKIHGAFILVDNYDNPSEYFHLYDNKNFEYEVVNKKLKL